MRYKKRGGHHYHRATRTALAFPTYCPIVFSCMVKFHRNAASDAFTTALLVCDRSMRYWLMFSQSIMRTPVQSAPIPGLLSAT